MHDHDAAARSSDVGKAVGYQFDEFFIVYKSGKYLFGPGDRPKCKIGKTPGKILWLLVESAYSEPGAFVQKEILLELVSSKDALKTAICRLKKGRLHTKINTERNAGYRIIVADVKPISEEAAETLWAEQTQSECSILHRLQATGASPPETSLPGLLDSTSVGHSDTIWKDETPALKKNAGTFEVLVFSLLAAALLVFVGLRFRLYDQDMKKTSESLRRQLQDSQGKNSALKDKIADLISQIKNQDMKPLHIGKAPRPSPNKQAYFPFQYVIGPLTRGHIKEHRIQLGNNHDVLVLTISAIDYASGKFGIELSDSSRMPILQLNDVEKDEYGNLVIVLSKQLLKSEAYTIKAYSQGKPDSAQEHKLLVRLQEDRIAG